MNNSGVWSKQVVQFMCHGRWVAVEMIKMWHFLFILFYGGAMMEPIEESSLVPDRKDPVHKCHSDPGGRSTHFRSRHSPPPVTSRKCTLTLDGYSYVIGKSILTSHNQFLPLNNTFQLINILCYRFESMVTIYSLIFNLYNRVVKIIYIYKQSVNLIKTNLVLQLRKHTLKYKRD